MSAYTMTAKSAAAKGYRAQVWTAEEIFNWLVKSGNEVTLWASCGHVSGKEIFGRNIYKAVDGKISVHAANGATVQALPLGENRTLRILVK